MEKYSNYQRSVVADVEESLSKIAEKIVANSVVLDIGCSCGMLGQYLVKSKACIVDGVDVNQAALEQCAQFYRKTLIRNLDQDSLLPALAEQSYDVIVLADVLEHLRDAALLLRQLKLLIKPNGTIIFSVPNVAHLAQALDLLFGNFSYRENGLLDSTHLRFFTRGGLVEKLEAAGIYPWEYDSVVRAVCDTEFGGMQEQRFPKRWIEAIAAQRPDALVYQWIISAKIYPAPQTQTQPPRRAQNVPFMTMGMYWAAKDNPAFNEQQKIVPLCHRNQRNEFVVRIDFADPGEAGYARLRFDPLSEAKAIWVKSAEIRNAQGVQVWNWTGQGEQRELLGAVWVEAEVPCGRLLYARGDDPQWHLDLSEDVLAAIGPGAHFQAVIEDRLEVIEAFLCAGIEKLAESGRELVLEKSQSERLQQQLAASLALRHALDGRLAAARGELEDANQSLAAMRQLLQAEISRQEDLLRAQQDNAQSLAQRLEASRHEMVKMRQTLSWRVTAPLRWVRTRLSSLRHKPLSFAKAVYRALPMPFWLKSRAKDWVFVLLSPFIKSTGVYQTWQRFQNAKLPSDAPAGPASQNGPGAPARMEAGRAAEYAEFSAAPADFAAPVKLVAFYLPQFHPIPENDAWWGAGFTEWTNVTRAVPQFEGHYQPHLPADLGFYDLRLPDVQKRQVALAKAYGIGAFCFYFYWFGGKTLLEHPVRQYLEHGEFDLPFCLCWANENWCRSWDGLNDNILIAQAHSPEDDLAFIAYVAPYLRDARYLRVNGKPVLLVYRPNLLPAARETAGRWRSWCRDHGIGEIYLVCTQSFEAVDPITYGFDAASEFPPNNSAPPDITDEVVLCNPAFGGTVYDWRVFPERSRVYAKPAYKLFRAVCPSWDNEARKSGRGTAFQHSSPGAFQEWVANASIETMARIADKDERLVFVNAWNEWAEGAHLEPDRRYGHAWLQAARQGLISAATAAPSVDAFEGMLGDVGEWRCAPHQVAVVLHLYYADLWDEISRYLLNMPTGFQLFVSVAEHADTIAREVLADFPQAKLYWVKNKGRDILPFITILPDVIAAGCMFVCKIHTKKSSHRADGAVWRKDLYDKMMVSSRYINEVLSAYANDPNLGIMGAAGHVVHSDFYWGENADNVIALAKRIGVDATDLKFDFVAGTMFWARVDAIKRLLDVGLGEADFEEEAGQLDGTIAHAVERLFPLLGLKGAYMLVDTDFLSTRRLKNRRATPDYQFATATERKK